MAQIQSQPNFEVYEVRLDYWPDYKLTELKKIKNQIKKPLILTLRTVAEGGKFQGDYKFELEQIVAIKPNYLDIEAHAGASFIAEIKAQNPTVKIIQSQHLPDTPSNLQIAKSEADIFKLVTTANSTLDALKVMQFVKNSKQKNLIMHAQGESGVITRLFAIILGQPLIFIGGTPDSTINEMLELYKINAIHPNTKILGLIGTPITHSLGRMFHNQRLAGRAVYVNLPLFAQELPEFFKLTQGLPFAGFSVTMPLKQTITKLLTTNLPAVNTICRADNTWQAYNTDGAGALAAIGPITGRVLIIGAGGSAAAVAAILAEKKVEFSVLNRTINKAKMLTDTAYDFESFAKIEHEQFAVVINATPNSVEQLALLSLLLQPYVGPGTKYLGLDYRNQLEPNLDVQIICPKILFYEQAAIQLKLFEQSVSLA